MTETQIRSLLLLRLVVVAVFIVLNCSTGDAFGIPRSNCLFVVSAKNRKTMTPTNTITKDSYHDQHYPFQFSSVAVFVKSSDDDNTNNNNNNNHTRSSSNGNHNLKDQDQNGRIMSPPTPTPRVGKRKRIPISQLTKELDMLGIRYRPGMSPVELEHLLEQHYTRKNRKKRSPSQQRQQPTTSVSHKQQRRQQQHYYDNEEYTKKDEWDDPDDRNIMKKVILKQLEELGVPYNPSSSIEKLMDVLYDARHGKDSNSKKRIILKQLDALGASSYNPSSSVEELMDALDDARKSHDRNRKKKVILKQLDAWGVPYNPSASLEELADVLNNARTGNESNKPYPHQRQQQPYPNDKEQQPFQSKQTQTIEMDPQQFQQGQQEQKLEKEETLLETSPSSSWKGIDDEEKYSGNDNQDEDTYGQQQQQQQQQVQRQKQHQPEPRNPTTIKTKRKKQQQQKKNRVQNVYVHGIQKVTRTLFSSLPKSLSSRSIYNQVKKVSKTVVGSYFVTMEDEDDDDIMNVEYEYISKKKKYNKNAFTTNVSSRSSPSTTIDVVAETIIDVESPAAVEKENPKEDSANHRRKNSKRRSMHPQPKRLPPGGFTNSYNIQSPSHSLFPTRGNFQEDIINADDSHSGNDSTRSSSSSQNNYKRKATDTSPLPSSSRTRNDNDKDEHVTRNKRSSRGREEYNSEPRKIYSPYKDYDSVSQWDGDRGIGDGGANNNVNRNRKRRNSRSENYPSEPRKIYSPYKEYDSVSRLDEDRDLLDRFGEFFADTAENLLWGSSSSPRTKSRTNVPNDDDDDDGYYDAMGGNGTGSKQHWKDRLEERLDYMMGIHEDGSYYNSWKKKIDEEVERYNNESGTYDAFSVARGYYNHNKQKKSRKRVYEKPFWEKNNLLSLLFDTKTNLDGTKENLFFEKILNSSKKGKNSSSMVNIFKILLNTSLLMLSHMCRWASVHGTLPQPVVVMGVLSAGICSQSPRRIPTMLITLIAFRTIGELIDGYYKEEQDDDDGGIYDDDDDDEYEEGKWDDDKMRNTKKNTNKYDNDSIDDY